MLEKTELNFYCKPHDNVFTVGQINLSLYYFALLAWMEGQFTRL